MASYWNPCVSTSCPCPNHNIPTVIPTTDDGLNGPSLAHLATTNDVPSQQEEATVRSIIRDLCSRRNSLDALVIATEKLALQYSQALGDIEELQRLISAENPRLDALIHKHQGVLSRIRSLPTEILQRIFSFTIEWPGRPVFRDRGDLPVDNLWLFEHLAHRKSMLWVIELVCRRWRNAVLASAELWSFASICADPMDFYEHWSSPRYLIRLARQLHRAHNHPLSVEIFPDPESDTVEIPYAMIATLMTYALRIQALSISLPYNKLVGLRLLHNLLDGVRYLAIHNTPYLESLIVANNQPISIFKGCRTLSLHDIPSPSTRFFFAWTAIQTLSVTQTCFTNGPPDFTAGATSEDIVNILVRTKTLQHLMLDLRASGNDDMWNTMAVPTFCPCLQSIHIVKHPSIGSVHPTIALFDHLNAPALKSIKLELDPRFCATEVGVIHSVANLIIRSGSSLESFIFSSTNKPDAFRDVPDDAEDIVRLLDASPMLESLELREMIQAGMASVVMGALTEIPLRAPHLARLTLTGGMDDLEGPLGGLECCEMVKARCGVLKQLNLDWGACSGEVDDERIGVMLGIRRNLAGIAGADILFGGRKCTV